MGMRARQFADAPAEAELIFRLNLLVSEHW